MEHLTDVSKIKQFHDGGVKIFGVAVPFTKTWTLEGFDQNKKLIVSVSNKERHNYLKFAEFIKQLKSEGYKITGEQRDEIKTCKIDSDRFLMEEFIPRAGINDLIEIANKIGISENMSDVNDTIEINNNYLYSLKNKDESCKIYIADQLGLEYSELQKILSNI
jgi:hypothetical protein